MACGLWKSEKVSCLLKNPDEGKKERQVFTRRTTRPRFYAKTKRARTGSSKTWGQEKLFRLEWGEVGRRGQEGNKRKGDKNATQEGNANQRDAQASESWGQEAKDQDVKNRRDPD